MDAKYTKAQRKKLRELAGIAYKRELDQELEKLYKQFNNWRNKKINGFELNELIHGFHQGISRDLWKFYNNIDAGSAVAVAIAKGLLSNKEVPEEIIIILQPQLDYYKDRLENKLKE